MKVFVGDEVGRSVVRVDEHGVSCDSAHVVLRAHPFLQDRLSTVVNVSHRGDKWQRVRDRRVQPTHSLHARWRRTHGRLSARL